MVRLTGEQQAYGEAVDAALALALPERHRLRRPGRQPRRAHGIGVQPRRRIVAPQHDAARIGRDGVGDGAERRLGDKRALRIVVPFGIERGQQLAHRRHRRRLAAGRRTDQHLPQHQRLVPARPQPHDDARAAEAGHGGEQRLCDIVGGRTGRVGGVQNPVAPEGRQQVDGKGRHCRARLLEQGHVDLAPAVRRRRRQWARVAGIVEGRQRIGPRQGDKRVGGPVVMTGSAARRHERALTITVVPLNITTVTSIGKPLPPGRLLRKANADRCVEAVVRYRAALQSRAQQAPLALQLLRADCGQ